VDKSNKRKGEEKEKECIKHENGNDAEAEGNKERGKFALKVSKMEEDKE
jgi:hypothetical protein